MIRIRPTSPTAIILVLMSGTLLAVAQLYLTVPLMPQLMDRHQVPAGTAAWVGAGFGAAYAVGSLIFGAASDRFDPRRVLAGGLLASAVATTAAGLSPAFEPLLVARTLQGFTAAAFPPVALALVGGLLSPRHRAVAIAAISSCFLLGGIVGQAYALVVYRWLGWAAVFTALVVPLVMCAGLVTRLPAAGTGTAAGGLAGVFARFGDLLRRPPLLTVYLCALAPLLTFVAMYSALNDVASDRFAIAGAGPLLALRLPGLPGIAIGACAGWFINRAGPYRTGALAFLVAAAGMAVESTAGGLWLLLLGSAVYVAGLAVAVPSAIAAVGLASGDARGTGIAGYTFLIGVGGAVAPLLAAATTATTTGFGDLTLMLAVLLVGAAAALGLGPRPAPARAAVS
ncbi:MAG: MFS transporter, partial [Dactylosporangium sp.]|nr:MFS transporter [Dactylosporangium sp.]NNJ63458.1 MFS transporter [Dactylosporangium sp.]